MIGSLEQADSNVAETPANGAASAHRYLASAGIIFPPADFTSADNGEPPDDRMGMRRTGGLTPTVCLSIRNCGVDTTPPIIALARVQSSDRHDVI